MWKSSRRLGAGIASYQSGSNIETIIVARYSPAGNLYNKAVYIENVKPMKAFGNVSKRFSITSIYHIYILYIHIGIQGEQHFLLLCSSFNLWFYYVVTRTIYIYILIVPRAIMVLLH